LRKGLEDYKDLFSIRLLVIWRFVRLFLIAITARLSRVIAD